METIETPAVEAAETVETVAAPATTNPFKERTKSWTPQQTAHWRATGDEPETSSSAATEESAEQAETSAEEAGTVETEAASAPAKDNEEKPKRGSYKELRERAARAEARAELLEQQLKNPAASKEEPKPAVEAKRTIEKAPEFPDIDKFKTLTEYNAAVGQWQKDLTAFNEQEVERKFQERDQRAQAEAENSKWSSQIDAQKKAHADYEAVAFNKNVPVSDAMLAVIKRHPKGAEILYAAGKNVAETTRIAELTNVPDLAALAKSNPARAAYLYGKAEALAEVEVEKLIAKKVTPQIRTAPKPSGEVAVSGKGGATVEKLDDDQLLKMGRISSGEWKRRANARDMAERRGA